MFGGFHRGFSETPDRPADPAVRRANLTRIAGLFRPYRFRLSIVLGLILISAAVGVVPAFLLRGVLQAIQHNETTRLSVLAGGDDRDRGRHRRPRRLADAALEPGRPARDARPAQRVFRHLQRLSLAFFTRTRTGEIQSRISNDIGGVQSVVTSTATSIVSNVTTVLATMIGMALLNWELSLFAFALIPVFVLLTRRVGKQRRQIAKSTQETLADISSLVQESLSVSGILLGKTMGRTDELADRFEGESQTLADLEVRQRMAGRWVMAAIQTSFAIMPVAAYWFAGLALAGGSHAISIPTLVSFTTLQTRLFFPVGSLLGVGLDVQTSLALFDRIFEYLDQPVEIDERPDARALDEAGDVTFDHVWFRYGDGAWTLQDVTFTVPAGTKTALVGETGAGKTTLGYLAARLYDVNEGSVQIAGVDVRDLSFASLADLVGVVSQETYLFHASVRDNLRFAKPDATDDEIEARRGGRPHPRSDRVAAGGLRHGRRRARLPLLRRREAADRDRAHDPAQPADPRAGRSDELSGHRDRAPGAGGARPARGGAHDDRDRPPAVDRPGRRPDRRPRRRADRRTRHTRGAARPRRSLRGARRPDDARPRRLADPRCRPRRSASRSGRSAP